MKSRCPLAMALCASLCPVLSFCDEGMWTFDNPPTKQLETRYGFTPTKEWLDHVRLASVRFNNGGSGSFVSPHGLVLTNHHIALDELEKNSTSEHDYVKNGFYADSEDKEMKSPDLEINVLMSMEDVTQRVMNAVRNAQTPEQAFAMRKGVIADITRESEKNTGLRSDIVTLYQGGEYWLYRYKKYTDVRIVFAPEQQIAYFGGDPDNFTYPRYDMDMALFRVYENGKPVESRDYLKWNPKGAANNELVFVSGNPGATQRLDTMAQLVFERDVAEPNILKTLRSRIATLKAYSALGAEQAREATERSLLLENSRKAYEGRYDGLRDHNVMSKKQQEEDEFRGKVDANPEWKAAYGGGWDAIAEAMAQITPRYKELFYKTLDSDLADLARTIVEYVAETKKPDGERLPGYHDAQLNSLRFRLASPAPIYKSMEIARMTGALELDRSELGDSDPFLKAALDGRSPKDAATEMVNGTHMDDPESRKKLMAGGEGSVAASTDPMIVLARKLDPMRRAFAKWREDKVQSVIQKAGEQLGKARFAVYGKTAYPDATFTLRLSYGQVKGFPMNGTEAPYKTTLYGLYDRATSFDFDGPFYLPARYLEGRTKLDLATPMDFVTTDDIIGGNSGSPVINRNAELVGLIFDGNIESLVGDFVYDEGKNRAVAVHPAVMTEAMRKLYGAQKLVDELMDGAK